MAKRALTVNVRIDGVREILKAFNRMPKDATNALRDASKTIAEKVARKARSAGQGLDAQSAAVASTVKVARDRVPAVQAGGAKRVTSSRVPAYSLLFGSEFGADGRFGWYAKSKYGESTGRQFSPHQGQQGRWFFPTVEAEQATIAREWGQAVDEIIDKWGR